MGIVNHIFQEAKRNPIVCGCVGLLAMTTFVIGELALINPCGCFNGILGAKQLAEVGGLYLGTSVAVTGVFLLIMNERHNEKLEALQTQEKQSKLLELQQEWIQFNETIKQVIQEFVKSRPAGVDTEKATNICNFIMAQCLTAKDQQEDIEDAQLMWGSWCEGNGFCSSDAFEFFL